MDRLSPTIEIDWYGTFSTRDADEESDEHRLNKVSPELFALDSDIDLYNNLKGVIDITWLYAEKVAVAGSIVAVSKLAARARLRKEIPVPELRKWLDIPQDTSVILGDGERHGFIMTRDAIDSLVSGTELENRAVTKKYPFIKTRYYSHPHPDGELAHPDTEQIEENPQEIDQETWEKIVRRKKNL